MTQEQKRIAIAKACGWVIMADGRAFNKTSMLDDDNCVCDSPPNYFNSLDAMHEAEKVKEMAFDSDYAYWLAHVAVRDRGLNEDKLDVGDGYQIALTTTAAQRAEAFGLTLGLWKEGE